MTTTESRERPVHCRSCNAMIWWKINPSGRRQPFDYDEETNEYLTMPHHATCPQGREWQRKHITPEEAGRSTDPKDPKALLEQNARLKVALARISSDALEAIEAIEQ